MPRNGGHIVVDALQAAGIDTIFGLEGGHIDTVLHAARDAGMRLIDVRHEAVGGYAADGFMRTTGRPAVAVGTAGPGFANMLTAIVNAHLDRVPALFIAGGPPMGEAEANALQGNFDQVAMARPVTKWADRATSVDVVGPMINGALQAMFEGAPGPAFLELPIEVAFEEIDDSVSGGDAIRTRLQDGRPAPAPDAVERALALLQGAERPVVLAGSGALLSGCGDELRTFAEAAGAPVYANIKALGILPGPHPLACGSFTSLARMEADPDVVLILGARNGMFMGGASNDVIPADAQVIHVDVDRGEIGRLHPAAVAIVADCREVLAAFNRADVTYADRSAWTREAKQAAGWHRTRYADAFEDDGGDLHPYRVAAAVADVVDDRTVVVQDGGDAGGFTEVAVAPRIGGPGKYLSIGYLGNLGIHQGFGIAAQVAHPDHRVICVTGDGSLGLQIQEFDTMVRHGLPIVTVVMNNRMWGMSYEYQVRMPHGLTWVSLDGRMRYDLICEACGGHGEMVETGDDLAPAIGRALASGKPACVNVLTRSAASPKSEAYLRADGLEDAVVLPYYSDQPSPSAKVRP